MRILAVIFAQKKSHRLHKGWSTCLTIKRFWVQIPPGVGGKPDRFVENTIDRKRLVEKIAQMQIDREYLEESGGESILSNLHKPDQPNR